jgi:rhodanese-related sulfurtransferase
MRLCFVIIFTFSVFAAECKGGDATDITGEELARQAASESRLTIVDVRSSGEYESGHIPGAIHIPFWAILTRHSDIPTGHDEPVVIYCEHGPRAKLAKLFLNMAGFDQVVYLTGHMSSWRKAGLPVEPSVSP